MTEESMREAFDEWFDAITAEGIICNRWDAWQACQYFCKWQIEKDAKKCETGLATIVSRECAKLIRNQEKE